MKMQDSTEAQSGTQLQHNLLNLRGVHVLVVDDYQDNVTSLALLLRYHGHEVDTALEWSSGNQPSTN
jgi:PleD family two-component response regulator